MTTEQPAWENPIEVALNMLAYGARGIWTDTATDIAEIHATGSDILARAMAAMYQAVRNQEPETFRVRIGRTLVHLDMGKYAAVSVAETMLDRLASNDMPGYADTWDAVRYGFSGRNVVPVTAAFLIITLGSLESEKNDAYMLLDRLTADGTFAQLLAGFGPGDEPIPGPA